jgi:hypothetical protein
MWEKMKENEGDNVEIMKKKKKKREFGTDKP